MRTSHNKKYNCERRGAKMTTQAEEEEKTLCGFVIPPRIFWKIGQVDFL
jgi:hypothetical protein